MTIGKLLELIVDKVKLCDELNDNVETFCDDHNNYIDNAHHSDIDARDTCCNGNNENNKSMSLLYIIIVDNNNVNLNGDVFFPDMQDNSVDSGEKKYLHVLVIGMCWFIMIECREKMKNFSWHHRLRELCGVS